MIVEDFCALCRKARYEFGPGEGLFRGRSGDLAVADADGPGRVVVRRGEGLLIETDRGLVGGIEAKFDEWATVWRAEEVGATAVEVQWGPEPRLVGPGRAWAGGCGWVRTGAEGALVDGVPWGPGELVPAFREVVGDAEGWGAEGLECVLVDAFDATDPLARKARAWTVQNATDVFEVESLLADGTPHVGRHLSHLNAATWTVALPTATEGLRLRKFYDRFHGRQRARVLIDGAFAGWWYEPLQNRERRWAWSEVGVGAEQLLGKAEIRLTVDPPAGTSLWSVSRIEVWALKRVGD